MNVSPKGIATLVEMIVLMLELHLQVEWSE